jgi:Na+-driven multidrug efflux pump
MAQRNSAWPSLVIFASASVNVVLDLLLIVNYGMGAVGAAWATLASQYFGLALLMFIVQAFGDVKLRLTIPQRADLQSFQSSTGSLAFIYVCKNICYLGIQRVATALPMLSVAAHQPVFSLWSFCSFCTSPLEQVTAVYSPRPLAVNPQRPCPTVQMTRLNLFNCR